MRDYGRGGWVSGNLHHLHDLGRLVVQRGGALGWGFLEGVSQHCELTRSWVCKLRLDQEQALLDAEFCVRNLFLLPIDFNPATPISPSA